ncbi:MAG: hypothetical protein AABX73_01705 [Nanoarchaeota archaeon]
MKKSLIIVVLIASLMFLSSFVFAQSNITDSANNETSSNESVDISNETEVDDDTEKEVEVMDISHGARMRALQLQFQIMRRVLWGEAVIERLGNKTNVTTTELEGIVEELRLLGDEAGRIYNNETANVTVQHFIDIKKDAKALVKEFRKKARLLLSEGDKNALRLKFSEIDRAELKELHGQISEQRRLLNAERARRVLAASGAENEDILRKIKDGEISKREALEQLKTEIKIMKDEEKDRLKEKLREEENKRRELKDKIVSEFKEKRLERASDRLADRAVELRKKGAEKAGNVLEKNSEALRKRAEKVAEKREAIRDALKVRTANTSGRGDSE